ncbi:5'-nucleotidase C-terminal domain-containing protein [Entomospira culicis]|uniref:Bifunctional metallophosphatase/5'-nucleotidase n=1 Tax=Entomospira culicis TaxID=2719989 RepID=A0A968KZN5_9SPIO|nr:5'-nucleotidase C-terminal domain-containing protein [Entomospira culicis]NIZ19579.1 bifunctional metallophosphatase/5'-nucleotidase [Entomospira culicis]NIZ69516.1 bifunctional metallophosphatase/5'-nucleotidase [Entomospira culicis]WDI36629.1 5'-nucleotidase C-terminal domain-containing protein [Entomospira culicis]WDI38258.1 5'-nucleotidase C-terminal domain-containing protein [Entomospira culicis]
MKRWIVILALFGLMMSCSKESSQSKSHRVVVQVLQTSDVHGKFINHEYAIDEATTTGSLAAVATKVAELRKEYPHTILIDTGDTFQDNSNELFIPDAVNNPMLLAMNMMDYDSMTVGNHEFNFGIPYLLELRDNLNFDVLGANVYDAQGERLFKPYKIIEKNGVRVAIVGMVTPNITRWDADNLRGYQVTTPLEEMNFIWNEIADEADLLIFANHMSWADEYQYGDGYATLLEFYPQFHLALVAHEHSRIEREEPNGTIVLEPSSRGAYVSQALFTFEKDAEGKYQLVDKSFQLHSTKDIPDDPKIVSKTKAGHEFALADARRVIGRLEGGSLVPEPTIKGVSQAQLEPTAMIALINDVQRFYTDADVSSVALFIPNSNMHVGDISKANVSNIYKYDNMLRSYRMSGAQLKEYMEWSATYFNQFEEGDLTISYNPSIRMYNYDMFGGVQYDIDISQPVGNRIKNLRWPDGRAVSPSEMLTIAVNDYRAQTTLLSDLFPDDTITQVRDLYDELGDGSRVRDLIIRYIQEEKGGIIDNSFDRTQHNFRIIGYNWDEALRKLVIEKVNNGTINLPTSTDGRTPNVRSLRAEDLN